MKRFTLTLIVSVFLVTSAQAQMGGNPYSLENCALCVPAQPLSPPRWTHPQPNANTWQSYVPSPNWEAERNYQRSKSAPRHDLNPGGRALTDAYSSGADYWYENRTTRDIYRDQGSSGCGWSFDEC